VRLVHARDVLLHPTTKVPDVILFSSTTSRADLLIAVNVALLSVNGYNVYRKIKYSSPPPPSSPPSVLLVT
jgi:hypothetical protein